MVSDARVNTGEEQLKATEKQRMRNSKQRTGKWFVGERETKAEMIPPREIKPLGGGEVGMVRLFAVIDLPLIITQLRLCSAHFNFGQSHFVLPPIFSS